jgi:hypothetical protein
MDESEANVCFVRVSPIVRAATDRAEETSPVPLASRGMRRVRPINLSRIAIAIGVPRRQLERPACRECGRTC